MRKILTAAVLFADIAQSTQLYGILGDEKAQAQITSWINLLAAVTQKHKGIVVKTIGDEVMCTFRDVPTAIAAGQEMHRTLDRASVVDFPEIGTPNIYVGIHLGKIIVQKGDIFGDAVNIAARLVAMAKQRQILLSQQACDALPPSSREYIHYVDGAVVKGTFEEIKLFEYIWEQLDITVVVDNESKSSGKKGVLELRMGDLITIVDQLHPIAMLGRQPHNDIVLTSKKISRSHARIEYRWGKFVFTDQSSNGTYIVAKDGRKKFLKRGELVLPPEGRLLLGENVLSKPEEAIYFLRK